jgi:CheY-like chemotaxis protein
MDPRKGVHILVAEDSPADATLVREALAEAGVNAELHVIPDGAQVLAFLDRLDADQNAPALDLVLLDMHLPKCDGDGILKRLRSARRHRETPVIVMTSSPESILEHKAMNVAALSFFRKPSSLDEFMKLGAIVRDLLQRGGTSGAHQAAPRQQEPIGGNGC